MENKNKVLVIDVGCFMIFFLWFILKWYVFYKVLYSDVS